MARTTKTGFDKYLDERMQDPAFATEYAAARKDIDTVDGFVRALDQAREAAGLSKAALARRAKMPPEVVRRLFTADGPNPTLETVVKLAGVLDLSLALHRRAPTRARAKDKGTSARTGT